MSKYNEQNTAKTKQPVRPKRSLSVNGPEKSDKAVALKYNSDSNASPVVIASGYGDIAERIINIAENRGIPVYRDDSAASMLCMLDVGSNIPEELYGVVATIYAQILTTAGNIKGTAEKETDENDN
ncbi:MAG: EscU/YscU/HrcU family type III secretion system export apparatus switch protein [Clostridia bacterium]